MPLETISLETLEELKRVATARAEQLGHRLQVFRTAKQDPQCYVSFCDDCRQMVLLDVAARQHGDGGLFGYALEAPCAARPNARGTLDPVPSR